MGQHGNFSKRQPTGQVGTALPLGIRRAREDIPREQCRGPRRGVLSEKDGVQQVPNRAPQRDLA